MGDAKRPPTREEIHKIIDERLNLACEQMGTAAGSFMVPLLFKTGDVDEAERVKKAVEMIGRTLTIEFQRSFVEGFSGAVTFYATGLRESE